MSSEQTSPTPALLPCPFCGGDPFMQFGATCGGQKETKIHCVHCSGSSVWRHSEAEAVTAWNRRRTPDQNPPVDPQALALSVSAALADQLRSNGWRDDLGGHGPYIWTRNDQDFYTLEQASESLAALAAAAETKVLPRVTEADAERMAKAIAYALLWAGQLDQRCTEGEAEETISSTIATICAPIDPVPHTEGRNKSNHIPCTYCRGLGFIPSSMDIRQPTCPHCCGTKDEPEPHRAPFAPQVSDGFEREIKSIAGVSLG